MLKHDILHTVTPGSNGSYGWLSMAASIPYCLWSFQSNNWPQLAISTENDAEKCVGSASPSTIYHLFYYFSNGVYRIETRFKVKQHIPTKYQTPETLMTIPLQFHARVELKFQPTQVKIISSVKVKLKFNSNLIIISNQIKFWVQFNTMIKLKWSKAYFDIYYLK